MAYFQGCLSHRDAVSTLAKLAKGGDINIAINDAEGFRCLEAIEGCALKLCKFYQQVIQPFQIKTQVSGKRMQALKRIIKFQNYQSILVPSPLRKNLFLKIFISILQQSEYLGTWKYLIYLLCP